MTGRRPGESVNSRPRPGAGPGLPTAAGKRPGALVADRAEGTAQARRELCRRGGLMSRQGQELAETADRVGADRLLAASGPVQLPLPLPLRDGGRAATLGLPDHGRGARQPQPSDASARTGPRPATTSAHPDLSISPGDDVDEDNLGGDAA